MSPRRISFCIYLSCLLILISSAGFAAQETGAPDKEVVIDGRYVHDVGELWSHVTNWNLLGSMPGTALPFSDAPSAMWPAGSGDEYLWAAGLWVGGVVLGEQRVSTGAWASEFRPTEAPGDSIYPTAHGAPGGTRYPWPGADDDDDGQEDEELLNGLDDDLDGAIDEDFAAIANQHFFCRYNDYEPILQETNPDHNPLHIEVVQQSIQWSSPLADDFVGYDFTITNVGVADIEQVYLGMFSDCDIGPRGVASVAADDLAGSWVGPVQTADGRWVNVQMGYMYDGAAVNPVDGYVGWVLCGHTTDPAGVDAPVEPTVRTFQRFSGLLPFEQGGDPTNDAERYELLSYGTEHWDPDVQPGHEDDYRFVISSGPFAGLAPGESISYQLALVLGAGLDGLITNAAEAVAAYEGVFYDRDGDPANGDEHQVHWLLAEEAPVSAVAGSILARAVPDGAELTIRTNLAAEQGLAVVRRAGAGVSEQRWASSELVPDGGSSREHQYRLVDRDPAGWPRVYELVLEEDGWTQTLDQVDLDLPAAAGLALSASPNPFNPMVNLRISLPVSDRATLQVFDLRGRLVRTLWDGPRTGGAETLSWSGVDQAGRSVPSGIYEIRLETARGLAVERVTLVR